MIRNHVSDSRGGWQCIPALEGVGLWAALHGVAIPKQDGVWWEKHGPVWTTLFWGRDGRQCQYSRGFFFSHLVAALWPHRLRQCLNMARHSSFPPFSGSRLLDVFPDQWKKSNSKTIFGNKISLQNSICLGRGGTSGWTCYSLPWFGFWCIYSGWRLELDGDSFWGKYLHEAISNFYPIFSTPYLKFCLWLEKNFMLSFLMHNEMIEESNRLTEINNFSQSSIKLTQIVFAPQQ